MDKHTVIVIIASIAIVIPFVYSGWNIYAVNQLQIHDTSEDGFRFFDMISEGKILICNPSPFFVNFNKLNIITYFDSNNKGKFSSNPINISPISSVIINGTFSSESFPEAQYLALHFDGIFSGAAPERIDPRKLMIVTEFETPILGIIPYTVTKQYSGLYFWETMNGDIGEFNC
ncbi:MAG: thr operon leader peptide [Nitrosopumilaceae archaeon]